MELEEAVRKNDATKLRMLMKSAPETEINWAYELAERLGHTAIAALLLERLTMPEVSARPRISPKQGADPGFNPDWRSLCKGERIKANGGRR